MPAVSRVNVGLGEASTAPFAGAKLVTEPAEAAPGNPTATPRMIARTQHLMTRDDPSLRGSVASVIALLLSIGQANPDGLSRHLGPLWQSERNFGASAASALGLPRSMSVALICTSSYKARSQGDDSARYPDVEPSGPSRSKEAG